MIEPCAECGFDPQEVDETNVADRLRRAIDRIGPALADARDTDGREPEELRWSAAEYAGHLGDVFALFERRIRQLVETDETELEVVDHDAAVAATDHRGRDRAELVAAVEGAGDALLATIGAIRPPEWARVGLRAGEARSVLEIAQRAVHETEHHVLDMGRAGRSTMEP